MVTTRNLEKEKIKTYIWDVFILLSGESRWHQLEVNSNVSTSDLTDLNY